MATSSNDRAMTKADLIEDVYQALGGYSKKEAAQIVDSLFEVMKESFEQGEKVKISGFGNFVILDKSSRVGRNPKTGQKITISARRVLTFRPSQVLKQHLNPGRSNLG
mgnify:CR=1 FL=1